MTKFKIMLPMAQKREEDFDKPSQEGFVASHAGDGRANARMELEPGLAIYLARREETKAAIDWAEQALTAWRAGTLMTLNERHAKDDLQAHQLAKASQRERLTSHIAPVDGTVQQLGSQAPGGGVTPSHVLLVPDQGQVTADVALPNKDVGFVNLNQEAEIKLVTVPCIRYSPVSAKITAITASAVMQEVKAQPNKDGSGTAQITGGAVFPATQTLSQYTVDVEGKNVWLTLSMNVPTKTEPASAVSSEICSALRRAMPKRARGKGRPMQIRSSRILHRLSVQFCLFAVALSHVACQSAPQAGMHLDGPQANWVTLFEEALIPDELFEVRPGTWAKWPNGRRIGWPQFHWISPHTVVASMWRWGQWTAKNDELPQNWSFDLKSGTRQRIAEDGQIGCARLEHILIVRSALEGAATGLLDAPWKQDYANALVGTVDSGFMPFYASPFGQVVDAKHPLMSSDCLPAPHSEDFFPPDSTLSVLRLGSEGFIALNDRGAALLKPGQKPPKQVLTIFNAKRQKVATWDDPCLQQIWPSIQAHIVPVRQQKAYLSLQTGPHPVSAQACPRVLIRADGQIEPVITLPGALGALSEHSVRLIGITPKGPLWKVHRASQSAPWGWGGLYVQDKDDATQVLSGDFHILSMLSEDGCRLIAARSPEGSIRRYIESAPSKERQISKFISIDFCHPGENTWH